MLGIKIPNLNKLQAEMMRCSRAFSSTRKHFTKLHILISLLWPLSTARDLFPIPQVSMTYLAFHLHAELLL